MINKLLKKISEKNFYFSKPRKSDIVLYDRSTEKIFRELKLNKQYTVIDKKKLNIFVLFFCLIRLKFSYEKYFKTYINFVKPKIVISGIDNDIIFFKLKQNSKTSFVVIQNGYRFPSEKLFFKQLKKNKGYLSVDYFFLYNKFYSNFLNKYITFKPIIHGSIKNNSILINKKNKIDLLFISQFHTSEYHLKSFTFYAKKILSFVNYYSKKKNLKFGILFRNPKFSKNFLIEKKFYDNLCDLNYKIFYKKKINDFKKVYNYVDSAETILTIDSTLGYEALSRGKKVVLFHSRSLNNVKHTFGWPRKLNKSKKDFIPKRLDQEYLNNYFEKNININYNKWYKKYGTFTENVMFFDPQNKKLVETINHILKSNNK